MAPQVNSERLFTAGSISAFFQNCLILDRILAGERKIITPQIVSVHRSGFLTLSSVPAGKGSSMDDETDKVVRSNGNKESLRASEVRYRRLFETAKDGILILDGDTGRITDVNPFLQDMLGYSQAELIGKALWEIGPIKDIAASRDAMRQLQKQGIYPLRGSAVWKPKRATHPGGVRQQRLPGRWLARDPM